MVFYLRKSPTSNMDKAHLRFISFLYSLTGAVSGGD
jgi:hypothetical protein